MFVDETAQKAALDAVERTSRSVSVVAVGDFEEAGAENYERSSSRASLPARSTYPRTRRR